MDLSPRVAESKIVQSSPKLKLTLGKISASNANVVPSVQTKFLLSHAESSQAEPSLAGLTCLIPIQINESEPVRCIFFYKKLLGSEHQLIDYQVDF